MVVSRPKRKRAWRSSCSCRPAGALQQCPLGLLHWTCPCCLVGAWQYKLPWRWTCLPGWRSSTDHLLLCWTCSRGPTVRLLSTLQSPANWPAASGGGLEGTWAATTTICSSCRSGPAADPVPCMGMATDAGWAARQGLLSSLPLAPRPLSPLHLPPHSHASCSPPAPLREAKLCSVHVHHVPYRTID